METKNMQYWKARNMIPGIDQDSEGNTDLPDGKSGSSPLQDKKEDELFIKRAKEQRNDAISSYEKKGLSKPDATQAYLKKVNTKDSLLEAAKIKQKTTSTL